MLFSLILPEKYYDSTQKSATTGSFLQQLSLFNVYTIFSFDAKVYAASKVSLSNPRHTYFSLN